MGEGAWPADVPMTSTLAGSLASYNRRPDALKRAWPPHPWRLNVPARTAAQLSQAYRIITGYRILMTADQRHEGNYRLEDPRDDGYCYGLPFEPGIFCRRSQVPSDLPGSIKLLSWAFAKLPLIQRR